MFNPTSRAVLAVCALVVVVAMHNRASAQQETAADNSFSVVLLPDTQNYAEKYPDTYIAQTLWIRQRMK